MGVKKRVRIFETNNPWIDGPFTNAFSNNIYIPVKWRAENPRLDLRGVIGHELAHVKTKWKFAQDVALGIGGVVGLTSLVGWFLRPNRHQNVRAVDPIPDADGIVLAEREEGRLGGRFGDRSGGAHQRVRATRSQVETRRRVRDASSASR